jgi:endonuclease YncB( thermonuclease family)
MRRRRTGLVVGAAFALGFVIGGTARPALKVQAAAWGVPAVAVAESESPAVSPPLAKRLDPGLVYPAEVLRIIDGDTFVARVRVWPGIDVDTKVRLRGIDAAELHARCTAELAKAQAARTALQTILDAGGITVSRVGIDKYGGRVDASVATRNTADVSAAMLSGGWARAYDRGRRGSWCG